MFIARRFSLILRMVTAFCVVSSLVLVPSAQAAAKTLDVLVQGDAGWAASAVRQAGQETQFLAEYSNTTKSTQKQVYLTITTPDTLTLKRDSITLYNPMGSAGTKNFTRLQGGNGLKIGTIKPVKTVYVQYSVIVPAASKLECGVNTFTNRVKATVPETERTYNESATFTVKRTCAAAKPAPAKTPVVAAPTKPAAQPTYSCDGFTVNTGSGGSAGIEDFAYTAQNGATYKSATVDWGDGTTTVHDLQNVRIHVYGKNGTYPVTMHVNFAVKGSTASVNCSESVIITSLTTSTNTTTTSSTSTSTATTTAPATTTTTAVASANTSTDDTSNDTNDAPEDEPANDTVADVKELPNTGPGIGLVLFGMIVVAGSAGYQLWLRRRSI